MYRITTAEFVISAASPAQFPGGMLPEVAFVGRSNVGKSSLLNTLVGRRKLAKTSATPGKTRQINFFRINDEAHFADLPGYGYARVSKTEREQWQRLIEGYLLERKQLRTVFALTDIRHDPTKLDTSLYAWLESIGRRFLIVLTKHDKVSAAQAEARRQQVAEIVSGYESVVDVIPFSAQTRHNHERLVARVGRELAGADDTLSTNRA